VAFIVVTPVEGGCRGAAPARVAALFARWTLSRQLTVNEIYPKIQGT
jgi:hypothetical protein